MRTALILLCAVILVACDSKPDKPEVIEQGTVPVVAAPTQDEMMSAMLRGHPNSKKVCIDGLRKNSFFLNYGPMLPRGIEPEHGIFSQGWIFIEKVEFYKTSNDTWFITNQEEQKYIQVYPDTTGLICRTHNG